MVYRMILLVFGLGFAALSLADEPKEAPKKDADKPIRSLVFFRTKPFELKEDKIVAALKTVFPKRTIGSDEESDITVVATETSAICTLKKEKLTLLINAFPKPYVEDLDALGKQVLKLTGDETLAGAAKDHEAWFSVDILGDDLTAENEEAHYELLSKVIAPFYDKRTTLLYYPEKNKLFAANAATLKSLKAGRALGLSKDGVIQIEKEDAELKAAVETARKRWKEFEKAFAAGTGVNHSVKFKFSDKKNGSEFMWVSVDKIDGDTVVGKLSNVPNFLTNVKEGDIVKRPSSEIEDWLYIEDKKMVGGFSIQVLQDRQKKRADDKDRD